MPMMSSRQSTMSRYALVALVLFGSSHLFAQTSPFAPPTEAMDTLNGAGTPSAAGALGGGSPFGPPAGGPPPGGSPFDPAAGGGAPPASPFGGDAGAAANPFGPPGGGAAPAANPFGGGGAAPAAGGFENFNASNNPNEPPPLPPLPQLTRVLVGQRVYCAVTGRLLQDATWQMVWTSVAQANFYDDGTNGDAIPNDTYYTFVVEREDEISPIAWRLMLMSAQMVEQTGEMPPLQFFKLNAITDDSDSVIPTVIDKERDRDARVSEWFNKFLNDYRVDPNDVLSKYHRPFIPPPPPSPDMPPPPDFNPPGRGNLFADQSGGGAGGAGGDGTNRDGFDRFMDTAGGIQPDSVTGQPSNPAASSNYFSTTAVGGGGGGGR